MNRTSIAAFRTRAAREISDTLGTLIQLGTGKPFMAHVTVPQPTMSLETGGFNTDKSIKVRWPQSRAPRPAIGTVLKLVEDNLTFRVESATSLPGSPLSAEVHVTATRE